MNYVKINESDYENTYCTSDIHGCLSYLRKGLEQIKFSRKDLLIVAGDSCDRGERSCDVYELFLSLKNEGFQVIHIMGNHEKMFYDYMVYDEGYDLWMTNGGEKTLDSYSSKEKIDKHLDYIETMPFYVESENHIIVHAGVNPKFDIKNQKKDDLIWITNEFKREKNPRIRKTIVFGHSITKSGKIEFYNNNTIGIDCGCYKNNKLGILELKTKREYYAI